MTKARVFRKMGGSDGEFSMSAPHVSARFPTTAWSVLLAAKDPKNPESLAAMNRFIAGYWRPVFYYLRARGNHVQLAEDLTQKRNAGCRQQ